MIKVKKGNLKLSKEVGVWSIPAGMETCGRVCKGCYAIKAQVRFKRALEYRQKNLEASKLDTFPTDLDLRKSPMIRVHESGDFYSQDYINKWAKIARLNPETIFYAYTKRLGTFDFTEILGLPNFILHNSLYGGIENYGKNISTRAKEYNGFVCPLTQMHDGKEWHGKCGDECKWCMTKENQGTPIFFEKH